MAETHAESTQDETPQRHPRQSRDLVWFVLGVFALGIGREFDRLLTNLKLHDLGLPESAIGRVIASHQLGTWVAALPTAFLLARMRLRHLLLIGTVFCTTGLLCLHLSQSESLALFGEFCLGISLFQCSVDAIHIGIALYK